MMVSAWILGTALQTPGSGTGPTMDLEQMMGVIVLYAVLLLLGLAINVYLLIRYIGHPTVWVRKINRLLWRPWGWSDVSFTVLIILFLHAFVLGLLHLLHMTGWLAAWDEQYLWILAHSIVLHWAAIAIVMFRAHQRGISWNVGFAHVRWSCRNDIVKGVIAYVAAVPILIFYAAVFHVWLQWTGHEPEPQDVVRLFAELDAGFMFYYFIFLALFLAPVSEEILFRGLLLPALGRRWGMGAAILVSSVLFALMHFHIPSLVPLFVFSVALSLAYIYTESIIVPIVMHMLFNGVSLMVMVMIG